MESEIIFFSSKINMVIFPYIFRDFMNNLKSKSPNDDMKRYYKATAKEKNILHFTLHIRNSISFNFRALKINARKLLMILKMIWRKIKYIALEILI